MFSCECCSSAVSLAPTRRYMLHLCLDISAGTGLYIDDLVACVELSHLACGNLGKLYGKLKVDSDLCPPWDKLKEAEFWKRADLYQRMWDVLQRAVNRPSASIQGIVDTENGSVKTATFDLDHEGKSVQKVAAWGPVGALSAHRRIHLWFVEVGNDGLPEYLPSLVEQHKDSYLIIIGPEMGVWKCQGQLCQLKDANPVLWRYKTTVLHLFMREDPPLGARIPPQVNVARRVLMASPHAFKQHRSYLVTDYPWRTSILMSLIAIMDVPPKNVFLTMLYIPHATRPQPDVLNKMGQVLAHCDNWQCSFHLESESSDLDITATLKIIVQTAHSSKDQANFERQILLRGCCLNSTNILGMTKKHTIKAPVGDDEQCADSAKAALGSQTPTGSDRSPSEGDASVSGRSVTAFRPPRRISDAGSTATALEDRLTASRVRSAAEALEKEAESSASKASKKARTAGVYGAVARGKRQAKGRPEDDGGLDLTDFPSGDL